MQLIMLFGNEVLDAIDVNSAKLHQPHYIAFLQAELLARNEERLDGRVGRPHFALENVPSKMEFRSLLKRIVKQPFIQ